MAQEIGRLAQVEQGFNPERRVRTLAADNSIQIYRNRLLEKQVQGNRLQVVERSLRDRQSVYKTGEVIGRGGTKKSVPGRHHGGRGQGIFLLVVGRRAVEG